MFFLLTAVYFMGYMFLSLLKIPKLYFLAWPSSGADIQVDFTLSLETYICESSFSFIKEIYYGLGYLVKSELMVFKVSEENTFGLYRASFSSSGSLLIA